ncbi:hypothetical protein SDRG_14098 [Saprolegnia diclina VS20]|uniref:Uncharacterized protein n=1 Tax=Saprolegnia diclina (strain VS20) TaxID=1156394 RepID=T0Q0R6_SAPDV|nr:hypothetical protein SDRG_14098 [Saprolegnia diclina VS20]EQC28141.1 hypothetical protein SDRG_14098 [Saprolegnia diclina VS20]|eukprot:XP_008618427.1 hypothetical protein SDRG_14098 [Saprolegnia diclina VS20]
MQAADASTALYEATCRHLAETTHYEDVDQGLLSAGPIPSLQVAAFNSLTTTAMVSRQCWSATRRASCLRRLCCCTTMHGFRTRGGTSYPSSWGEVTFNVDGFSTALATSVTIVMAPVTAGHVVVAAFDLVATRPLDEAPPLSLTFEATVGDSMIGFAVHAGVVLDLIDLEHHRHHDGWFIAALMESFDVTAGRCG